MKYKIIKCFRKDGAVNCAKWWEQVEYSTELNRMAENQTLECENGNYGWWSGELFQKIVFWTEFCSPKNSYVEVSTPNVTVFGDWIFMSEIMVKQGNKGGTLIQ